MTEAARRWFEDNVIAERWQWSGGALCADHYSAHTLLTELEAEGFEISVLLDPN